MLDDDTSRERTRMLLAAAGLPASDGEIDDLAAGYAHLRAAVDALNAVPAARYGEPALRFRASAEVVEDWGLDLNRG
ncbi:MAG: hypothetical protein ACRDNL_18300 [Spirillospora sp.]